jgi:hypothetical protein
MEDEIKTIEDLAGLIRRTMASKGDIKELRTEMNQQFEDINARLGRIENLILKDYGQRIEQLEKQVKKLLEALDV